jgi:transcriptional regulator with XRE-family HTH domain
LIDEKPIAITTPDQKTDCPRLMNDLSTFSTHRLRERRGELKLSQRELAAKLNVSQSTYSGWENGLFAPSGDAIGKLAKALQLPNDEVVEIAARRVASGGGPRGVAAILAQASEYLNDAQGACDIWVLGPDQLPMIEDDGVRGHWIHNLAAGHSYHILWPLDLVVQLDVILPRFADLAEESEAARREVEEAESAKWGAVTFYAFIAHPENASEIGDLPESGIEYNRYVRRIGFGEKVLKVHSVFKNSQDQDSSTSIGKALANALRELMYLWMPETAIILYRPHADDLKTAPVANVRLMEVAEEMTRNLIGKPSRPMFWLGKSLVSKLNKRVGDVEAAHKAYFENQTEEKL